VTELTLSARQRVDRIKTLVGAARADIIESYRQRDWITLGYESWDALCAAEFGTVLRLSIEDRQQAAAELHDAGMSTRAIGSALGISDTTVVRALSGASNEATDTVTGLDGKSYPAKRPVVVDADTGEVLGEMVTSEQWQRENTLQSMLDADPDVRAANLRHRFGLEIFKPLFGLHLFDPAEMARVAPERLEDLNGRVAALTAFRDAYVAALRPPNNLRMIKES